MRRPILLSGILVLLVGMLAWSQQQQLPRQRIRRPPVPQNPADFSPDPPPVATPTPTPPPIAAPITSSTPQTAAAPSTQAVQAPPEILPPGSAPQVTYRNGLLTVQTTNSTLGSLLSAIRNKTGIQFEGLENGAPEHVAITMGPAPEGEVLATILAGSNFDYVVMERPDTPGIVQRVLLTPKGGTAAASSSAGQPTARAADPDVDDDDDAEEAKTPQDTPVRPPLAQLPPPQPQSQPTPQQRAPTVDEIYQKMKQLPEQTSQPQPQTQVPLKQQPQNAPPAQPPQT